MENMVAKHDRDHAQLRRMVVSPDFPPLNPLHLCPHLGAAQWASILVAASAVATSSYIIFRSMPGDSPTSRRHGAVHFTIPVLSPFTSAVSEYARLSHLGVVEIRHIDRTRDIRRQRAASGRFTGCCGSFRNNLAQVLYGS